MYTGEVFCFSRWKTFQTAINSPTWALPSPSVIICSPEETWRATALYLHNFPSLLAEASVNQEFFDCSREKGGATLIVETGLF